MVAPADHHGALAVGQRHVRGRVDGAAHEPRAGEPAALPQRGGGAGIDDFGLARAGHAAGLDLAQVGGEELEAMGGVAHEVALDQDLGDGRRLVVVQARLGQQGGGEGGHPGGVVERLVHGVSPLGGLPGVTRLRPATRRGGGSAARRATARSRR